jgi:hypothetical protein
VSEPHTRLIRDLLARCDGAAMVRHSRVRPWASATFTGARHRIGLTVAPAVADWLSEQLDTIVFAIPGHVVADIVLADSRLADGRMLLEIEALTIEAH